MESLKANDTIYDQCAVFGCCVSIPSNTKDKDDEITKQNVFEILYNGLIALQHR